MDSMERRLAGKNKTVNKDEKPTAPDSSKDALKQQRFKEGKDFWTAVPEGEGFLKDAEKFDNPDRK